MSQIQITKLTMSIHLGADAGSVSVPKLNAYMRIVPDSNGESGIVRVSHVYAQKLRRR